VICIRMPAGQTCAISNTGQDRGLTNRTNSGIYSEIIAFNSILTDGQCNQIEQYLMAKYNIRPVIPAYNSRVNGFFPGDSMTKGQGATIPYPTALATALGGGNRLAVSNVAITGTQAIDWSTAYLGQYLFTVGFSRLNTAHTNVAHIWLGTNDLYYSVDPATVLVALQKIWAQCRSLGMKVIAYTILSRSNSGTPGTFNTNRATLNAAIRACVGQYDYLVDVAADATIGPNGAETNTTYFQSDLVHMTNAGLQIVANLTVPAYTALRL
jgi:lysophospholipase L1-like esterase